MGGRWVEHDAAALVTGAMHPKDGTWGIGTGYV